MRICNWGYTIKYENELSFRFWWYGILGARKQLSFLQDFYLHNRAFQYNHTVGPCTVYILPKIPNLAEFLDSFLFDWRFEEVYHGIRWWINPFSLLMPSVEVSVCNLNLNPLFSEIFYWSCLIFSEYFHKTSLLYFSTAIFVLNFFYNSFIYIRIWLTLSDRWPTAVFDLSTILATKKVYITSMKLICQILTKTTVFKYLLTYI